MMRLLLLLLAMLPILRADDVFSMANADYEAGRFREAAERYETLLETGGPRVSVLQNLGSAYHRLGEDGRAILAFERGLLLAPRDADLRANLRLVRDRAAVFAPGAPDGVDLLADWMSRRGWAFLALAGAAALPICAVLWVTRRRRAALPLSLVALAASAIACAALFRGDDGASRGIVVAADVKLRLSPFDTAEETGALAPGRGVKIGAEKNGWFHVTDGASEGWMKRGDVEPLRPRPAL